MEEEIAEAFYPVTLPVLDKCLEFLDSLDTLFSGNGVIGTGEHGGGSFDTL